MKAAYKWRLQNGVYGYIIDETGELGSFIYNMTNYIRYFDDGTIETGTTIDEQAIADTVSKMTKSEYITAFNSFKEFVLTVYPDTTFLDVAYYYNIESDECTASSSSLKCNATDILFTVSSVTVGEYPEVIITSENTNTGNGSPLKYDMSFVFPAQTVYTSITSNDIITSSITSSDATITNLSGDSATFINVNSSAITVSSITANEFNTNILNTTSIITTNITSDTIVTTELTTNNITSDTIVTTELTVNNVTSDTIVTTELTTNNITSNTIVTTALTVGDITSDTIVTTDITASSIISDLFVLDGGTSEQYLMADGSTTILSAGTYIDITKNGDIVTISADSIEYEEGNNIKISGHTISAKGYRYNDELNSFSVGEFEKEYLGVGKGIVYSGGFLVLLTGTTQDFSVGDLIIFGEFSNTIYTVTGMGSTPNGLFTSPTFPSDTEVDNIYKVNNSNFSIGGNSFTAGLGSIASGTAMTVVGRYNYTTGSTNNETVFIIGDGNSDSERHDLFKVGGEFDYNNNIDNAKISLSQNDIITYSSNHQGDHLMIKNDNSKIMLTEDGVSAEIYTSGITYCRDEVYAKVNGVKDVNLGVPIGSITMWAGNSAPDGWLLCDGRGIALTASYSTNPTVADGFGEYQDLLDVIQNKYGNSTGVVNWVPNTSTITGAPYVLIPNLQQRFPLGALNGGTIGKNSPAWSTSLGSTGGAETNTLVESEMPTHHHNINYLTDMNAGTGGGSSDNIDVIDGEMYRSQTKTYRTDVGKGQGSDNTNYFIKETGGNEPHNNIPPFLALNFIIKYK